MQTPYFITQRKKDNVEGLVEIKTYSSFSWNYLSEKTRIFVLIKSWNFAWPQMDIVIATLDKKIENLKMSILVFYNFTSSFFDKKIYRDVPLTMGFLAIPTLLS